MTETSEIHFDNAPLEAGRPFENTLAGQAVDADRQEAGEAPVSIALDKAQLSLSALAESRRLGRDVGKQFEEVHTAIRRDRAAGN